jgi:hypothetical protein
MGMLIISTPLFVVDHGFQSLLDKPKTSKHSDGVIVSIPTWSVVDHGFQSLWDKPKTSKHSGGVIVSMPTWSVIDHGFPHSRWAC